MIIFGIYTSVETLFSSEERIPGRLWAKKNGRTPDQRKKRESSRIAGGFEDKSRSKLIREIMIHTSGGMCLRRGIITI